MVDAITVEVIRNKFQALLAQMRFLLFRSAYSSLVRESRDCSFGVCSPDGEMPFQGASNHLYTYRQAAQRLLAKVPREELHEGDIYIGNDPYEIGTAHTPDTVVLSPVIRQGVLVALCGSIAHKMDFGGAVPGSIYSGATEVLQEGFILPLVKYYHRGEIVPQVEALIRANVRNADLVLGDLSAQVGATVVGVQRVNALAARYGSETLLSVFEELLKLPEKRISAVVSHWPGRTAEAEAILDPPPNHDSPVRLHLRVTRKGGHLNFDFSQSDPQVRNPINTVSNTVFYLCSMCVLGMTEPEIIENTGVARAYTLVAKKGTIVNPLPPAPVGSTTRVMGAYIDVIMAALSALKGGEGIAGRGDCGTTAFGWQAGLVPGRRYVQYEIQNCTGTGATAWSDGVSTVNPHSYVYPRKSLDTIAAQETPVEILEAQFPVRIKRFELIPNSGGAAKFRGGASRRRVYEALAPAELNIRHAHGFTIPPPGEAGGCPGKRGRVVLNPGTPFEKDLEGWSYDLQPGDIVSFEGPGGGGFGDPFQRDPQLILRDVAEGLVTPDGARDQYGVEIRINNGRAYLDEEKTKELRLESHYSGK